MYIYILVHRHSCPGLLSNQWCNIWLGFHLRSSWHGVNRIKTCQGWAPVFPHVTGHSLGSLRFWELFWSTLWNHMNSNKLSSRNWKPCQKYIRKLPPPQKKKKPATCHSVKHFLGTSYTALRSRSAKRSRSVSSILGALRSSRDSPSQWSKRCQDDIMMDVSIMKV